MLLLSLALACAPKAPPTLTPDAVRAYRTDDGWVNRLRHYPGQGPPVVLVHGMGANHYNWDYREEVSLSHDLQQAGWDVCVVGLRGDPDSQPPEGAKPRQYSFADHARLEDLDGTPWVTPADVPVLVLAARRGDGQHEPLAP